MPIRSLHKDLQSKAILELNEDPDRIEEDIRRIKEWGEKQPHLNLRNDDQWILAMLRGCKFSLERTKQKLDLLYAMKTLTPEFFGNRDPFLPEMQEILDLGMMLPLPKLLDPTAPRIILFRLERVHPTKIRLENAFKMMLMMLDVLLMEDDNFVIAGNHAFIDNKAMTATHFIQLTPTILKKGQTLIVEAYSLRLKGFHAINVPSYAETTYNMFKSILDRKIVEIVHFYKKENEYDQLYKAVPLSILPTEYGGDSGSLDELTKSWKKKVESYKDWFLEDAKYCSDESKRPGKPKTTDELYGIEGSFRKLDFD